MTSVDRLAELEEAWGVGQFNPDPESIPGQIHWLLSELRRLLRENQELSGKRPRPRDGAANHDRRTGTAQGSVPGEMEGDLLNVAEAAEFLSISTSSMRRLIKSGDVQSVRVGVRTTRIRLSDLDDYAKTLP